MNLNCQTCGALLEVAEQLRTATCPYCDSPYVVERPPTPDRPQPTFALGFTLAEKPAREKLRKWLRGRTFFAHPGVKKAAVEHFRGVYVPAYLYSAVARSDYRAQIGETYYETQTYTDSKGKTQTRRVAKTEWRSLSGKYEGYVNDVVVTASKAVPNEELERIEPFDFRLLRRYTPAIVAGWVTEEPSLTRGACESLAREEARQIVGGRLRSYMPGDTHRDLQHHTHLDSEATDLALVPVWISALRYDPKKPPMRVLVNGQTGEAFGKVPLSALKITLTVLGVLLFIALMVLLFGWMEGS